uniref:Deoxynucleotidyltransferase terminal-interacting protein 1 n=1 Tax=Schistocephalus solidus TaxID=70667 RepID=A0A0X3PY23_SCHSO
MDLSSCQSPNPISPDVNKVILQYVSFTPPDCYTSTETGIDPLGEQCTFKQTSNMTDRNTITHATSSSFPLDLLTNSVEKFESLPSSQFIAENSSSKRDSMALPKSLELLKASDLSDLPSQTNETFKDAAQQPTSALNMRYRNMLNFPKYARRRSRAFDNRIKRTGMLLDPLATLAVLRKFLQPYINRDINAVISRYMDEFFSIAFKNIRRNLGESALGDGDLQHLQYSIMKNATAQFRPPSHQSDEQSCLHLGMDQHLHTQSASPHETPIPTVRESHRSLRHSVLPRKPVPQEHDSGREARAITEEYRRSELCELLPPGSPNRVSPSPSLEFSPLPPPLPPADGSTVPSRKSKRLSSQAPPPPTSVAATAPLLNGDLQSDRFGHHHLNPLSCGSNVGAPSSMSVSSRSPSTGPPSQLGLQSIAEGDEDDVATSPSPPSSPESGFSMAKPEASTVTAPLRATKRNHQRIFRHYNNYSGGGGSGSAGKRRLGNSEHLSHLADPYALSSELDEGSDQFEKSASLVPGAGASLGDMDSSRGHSPADRSTGPNVSLPSPISSTSKSIITNEDTFVLGSVANAWLGLGAARGRIYTKHPWLFRYLCDVADRVWLAQAGHLPNCGIKAFLMLTRQVQMLGKHQKPDICERQGALVGFSLPPWLLRKVLHSANQDAHSAGSHDSPRNSSRPPSVKVAGGLSSTSSGHQLPSNEPALVNHVTVFQAPSSSLTSFVYRPSSAVISSNAETTSSGRGCAEVGTPCPVSEHFDMDRQLFRLRRTGASTSTDTWQVVNGGGGGLPKYALRRTAEATESSQSTAKADVHAYFDADGARVSKLSRMPTAVYDGQVV